jgi:hypothetical protein
MNAMYIMSLGSFLFAAVSLHKDNMFMFGMWSTIAMFIAFLGGLK